MSKPWRKTRTETLPLPSTANPSIRCPRRAPPLSQALLSCIPSFHSFPIAERLHHSGVHASCLSLCGTRYGILPTGLPVHMEALGSTGFTSSLAVAVLSNPLGSADWANSLALYSWRGVAFPRPSHPSVAISNKPRQGNPGPLSCWILSQ